MNILKKYINISDKAKKILEHFTRCSKSCQSLVKRSKIILSLGSGKKKKQVAREEKVDKKTVKKWCNRWNEGVEQLIECENNPEITPKEYSQKIVEILSDSPRSGAPGNFTPEQIVGIVAIACEVIDDSQKPVSRWTLKEIAEEAVKRKIVDSISIGSVWRFLEEADVKPHKSRYWMNTTEKDPEVFNEQCRNVCDIYHDASQLYEQGVNVVCNDEKTGIQAIQRADKTLPAEPGASPLQRVEYNYKRHGTLCLTANFLVPTGEIIAPTIAQTRKEEDYVNHIRQTIATDPDKKWIFVVDQLNTHKSASLVEFVAQECSIDIDLGVKEKKGILKSMETRQNFLTDPEHQIRFIYTPKHSSWLNQVEIWFSILTKRLLKYGSFFSLKHLKTRISKFIDFFNKTMAKPFKWTYKGRPLAV